MRRLILQKGADALLRLLYPLLCMHCHKELSIRGPLFCSICLEQLSLVEREGRCRTCFYELHKGRCEKCIHRKVVIHHQLAACEQMGPAHTLLREIDQGNKKAVTAVASLMAYQWLEAQYLLPEILIPLPISFWRQQKIGFDPQQLLSQEIGKIFNLSTLSVLRRRFDHSHFMTQGEFSYRVEGRKQRGDSLCDRRVLLIALEQNDTLFRSAGKELKLFFPTQIDALAFVVSET